jgi:guanylate kinase
MELDERLRQKIVAYKPSLGALKPIRRAPLLFLVGITGAGKDAIIQQLLATYPTEYEFIISHVTRQPRINDGTPEHDGEDYHFIDFVEAARMIDAGEYIEADIVHSTEIYGTSIAEVERIYDAGKIALTDVTIAGADNYVRLGLNAKPVFLLPPSYNIWKRRLLKREGTMDKIYYKNRLQSAVREITHALSVPHFYIVINDHLSTTAELVNRIGHDEPVEPHYHKAMVIAEHLLEQIKQELSTLDA